MVRLLLEDLRVDVNKKAPSAGSFTALHAASQEGHAAVVRLLLEHHDVMTETKTANGQSALLSASSRGSGAVVRLLVAHRARAQERQLAAEAIVALPADLIRDLPDLSAQVAALLLPLDAAAALGDTEEERAAADVLATESEALEWSSAQVAAASAQTPPQELARVRVALARAQAPTAAQAALEREADAALRAATTTTAFRLAQARQLAARKMLINRFEQFMLGAGVSVGFATLMCLQKHKELSVEQAESAARFALRHNGQLPEDRLRGPTRALAAAIEVKRAERDRFERAVSELFADASALSISQ